QQTFYVAVSGDDSNAGTAEKPFRSLVKARDAVRAINGAMTGDIVVVLRGGTHRLEQTLVLEAADSGTNGHCVVYRNHPGEVPVLSGGKRITGWAADAAGRWKATTDIANFRQLYVNGVRAVRAKGGPLPGAAVRGEDGYRTSNAQMAEWRNPGDIEFCYHVVWTWTRCKVKSIEKQGNEALVTMQQPSFYHARTKGGVRIALPSYVENAFELLDEPGEWYCDRPARTVYYIPLAGQDMATAEVIAPAVETLVLLQGTLDKPVHHVRFEGVTFADAGWLRPSEIGHVDVQANFIQGTTNIHKRREGVEMVHNEYLKSPSNIVCHAARNVSFAGCTFTRLGSGGIDLECGSQDNEIAGCEFLDIAGTPVQIGDVLKNDHHPDDERLIVRNNTVANCYIHDSCVEYKGGVGIFVGYTDGTKIVHNEICNLPYTGVSVGWGWGEEDAGGGAYHQDFFYDKPTPCKNNRIEFNHIHHVMQQLQDGGGIYTLGNQPGTIIQGNHLDHNRGGPGGVYLDEGSGFIEVTRNSVHDVPNPMNYNNRAQNRIKTCNEHDNFFNVRPGGAALAGGKVGKALLCDGASSFFETPDRPELEPAELTIEAWVYLDELPAGDDARRWIVNKNANEFAQGHYALMVDNSKVGAYLNIGGGQQNCHEAFSAAGVLAAKTWQHLACTYDGADLKVYLNGVQAASTAINKKRQPGKSPLVIGRRQDAFNYFKGLIDEVRLYNRALTAEEIKASMEAVAAGPAGQARPKEVPGLVAHWSFDEPQPAAGAVQEVVEQAGLEAEYRKLLKGKADGR
ncbi:MAG: right-handed parallel beta-helix repeat-containing protein, partial [Planctomycetota bacterium]|nr:right-handed parallel beta-helix repeat-containing protein [Planctomycetota bacterium]